MSARVAFERGSFRSERKLRVRFHDTPQNFEGSSDRMACGQFKPFSFFLDRPSAPVVVKANLTAVKQNSGPDPHCAAG